MPKKVVENHEDQVEKNEEEAGSSIARAQEPSSRRFNGECHGKSHKEASGTIINAGVRKAVGMGTVAPLQEQPKVDMWQTGRRSPNHP